MEVLLLSAYAAQSHRQWRNELETMLPSWQWHSLELPPRYFSWRIRGNPLYWSRAERGLLEQSRDLLVATSMVDLATLRGLVPALAGLPTALYFHENQFQYPQHRQAHGLLEAQMVSLYAALAADRLLFNSAFNRDSFLDGVAQLLRKMPDRVPAGVAADLASRAEVLPVPVNSGQPSDAASPWTARGDRGPLRLVWLGRFEHDKGGDRLLQTLDLLHDGGLDFELAVVGQQFRDSPDVFGELARKFASRLVQFGYMEQRTDYLALLRDADMVLSTALHEFQGLAILEAVALGCVPVLPCRQAYPDIYPAEFLYPDCGADLVSEAGGAARLIRELAQGCLDGSVVAPDIERYSRQALAPRYREVLSRVAARG